MCPKNGGQYTYKDSIIYRICIVYLSCMYRDYQRNYGCKGMTKTEKG